MEKKNYKFQNHFQNNNQEKEISKENRIKGLYTTIIKSNKKHYNNINDYNKSSSRVKKENQNKNSQKNDEDKKNSFSKNSYIKTEGNENENSPIHIKLVNTISNLETPKINNKIINVKIQETGNFNSNQNIQKMNNNNSNKNLRHSTSLSSSKINDKMKIILFSGNKNNDNIKNKNQRNNSLHNKLFNSCINFNSSFKNKKDKNFSGQISIKNKQKIKFNNNKDSKSHKSEIKSFSISQNQITKKINIQKKKDFNSLSKKKYKK